RAPDLRTRGRLAGFLHGHRPLRGRPAHPGGADQPRRGACRADGHHSRRGCHLQPGAGASCEKEMRDEAHGGPDRAATPRVSRRKFLRQAAMVPMALVAARHPLTDTLVAHSGDSTAATIRIDTARVRNAFDPDQAMGTSMDILPPRIVDKIYTPEMVKQCLSAGWGPITYRQNTELQIAAWHWNPNGAWSDPHNRSGYFTGSTELGEPIRHSYGYPLPHRGHTRNGGTEHGYSRLTDGDPATYWKSNPYLTSRFTGEDSRPQWVVIDLAHSELVNAIRIDWANPYARVYQVQYWTG